MSKMRAIMALAAVAFLLGIAPLAHAVDFPTGATWNLSGVGSWSANGNWNAGSSTGGAVIDNGGTVLIATGDNVTDNTGTGLLAIGDTGGNGWVNMTGGNLTSSLPGSFNRDYS